jgi:hypothetical protein
MPARAFETRHGTALTGMVLLGDLAQRTGRPIEWDAEPARDERNGGRGADLASLSPKLAVFKEREPKFLVSRVIHRPRPATGSVDRAASSHSEVVIRGRPRPLRGMSMSSDGT